jgi:hypothetical protein
LKTKNILIGGLVGLLLVQNVILHKNLQRAQEDINSIKYTVRNMNDDLRNSVWQINSSIETIEESKLWIKEPSYDYSSFDMKNKTFTVDLSFFVSSIDPDSKNTVTWLDLDNKQEVVKSIDLGKLDSLSVFSSTQLPMGHKYRAIFSSKNGDLIREEIVKDIDFSDVFRKRFETEAFFPHLSSMGNGQIQLIIEDRSSLKDTKNLYGDIVSIKTELIYNDKTFFEADILNDILTRKEHREYEYEKSLNFIELGLVKDETEMQEMMELDKFDEIQYKTTIVDSLGVTYEMISTDYGERSFRVY